MQQNEHRITLSGKQARYYSFSDDNFSDSEFSESDTSQKPLLHFYGGNGFVTGVYQPLIEELSQRFDVISLAMQGYWYDLPKDEVLTREQDRDYLIEFLEKTQDKPVIGIGHSQGASATAMAAAKRPDLFSKIYLIDPVTFTKKQSLIYSRIPHKILMTQEPFKSTKAKQTDWGSVEEYYQHLRQHRAFKRISDDNLRVFAKNSLVTKPQGGYTLLFQPQYELASYFGTPYITPALKTLNKLNNKSKMSNSSSSSDNLKHTPYHLILAKPSVFNSNKVRDSWKKVVATDDITTLSDYGHLLPMEAPKKCAEVIFELENIEQVELS